MCEDVCLVGLRVCCLCDDVKCVCMCLLVCIVVFSVMACEFMYACRCIGLCVFN